MSAISMTFTIQETLAQMKLQMNILLVSGTYADLFI